MITKIEADELLEKLAKHNATIRAAEEERDAFINHYQAKIARTNDLFEKATIEVRQEIEILTEQLRQFTEENLPEGKKTLKLPSGKLLFRKQSPKFYFADESEVSGTDSRLIDFARKNAPEYLKTKTVETADWAELKKALVFDGIDVYLKDGQLLEGVHVQILPDKFTVELS